ncbi:MAG: hypothetical protein MIL41_21895 [Hyphomicrobiales bacterium]|jgi:hypothetical protein
MASFQEAYLADLLRQQAQAQTGTMWEAMRNAQARTGSRAGDTFDFRTMRAAEPRKPSRFDGPDVIDLVQGADGVWRVPPALEARVRER